MENKNNKFSIGQLAELLLEFPNKTNVDVQICTEYGSCYPAHIKSFELNYENNKMTFKMNVMEDKGFAEFDSDKKVACKRKERRK